MLEKYYELRASEFYKSGKIEDTRPESGYQCGVLPEQQERARDHSATLSNNPHFDKVFYNVSEAMYSPATSKGW